MSIYQASDGKMNAVNPGTSAQTSEIVQNSGNESLHVVLDQTKSLAKSRDNEDANNARSQVADDDVICLLRSTYLSYYLMLLRIDH